MSKPIQNNSQLLYTQARQLFEQARTKFEDGSIKTDATLIQSVFTAFQDFFTSMGKPNMVPRYAPEQGPPWSDDYNSMMSEILKDLQLLFQEMDILGRTLYTDFNHNMTQYDTLNTQYEAVLDKMRDLEILSGRSEDNVDFGRDDFLNKDKIDYSRIAGTPLEIVDGAVTLPQTSRENVAPNATVTIVVGNREENKFILGTESNGFPGNNTEIQTVTDDVLTNSNYVPTFIGQSDNHGNYATVLDGNPNTWFEYEKVNVRPVDKSQGAKNLGWNYQVYENQTIQWAEDPSDGTLKLHMQITLAETSIINQINCNMYTPPNYGAKTAVVKNILVSDGVNVPVSILPANKTDDQYSFHFAPVKAKVISIQFEQDSKYITDIGHIYYEKKMEVNDGAEYAMDSATRSYQYAPRIEGPLVALEDLGLDVKVSDSTVSADYPQLAASSTEITTIAETMNRLTNSIDIDTVDIGIEKFEGFRWAICVRDIEIFSCEYAEQGELVTYPFYFDNPLDKISLNVDENIPSILTTDEALKYDWLSYYVSIDDGATWNPITPLSHQSISADQPPKIYNIYTTESAEPLNNKHAYLESAYPVYSIRLKIVGARPEDFTTQGFMLKDASSNTIDTFAQASPIVSSYRFDATVRRETINSEENTQTGIVNLSAKPNTTLPTPVEEEEEIPEVVIPPTVGGPLDDDDGDGIANHLDPDWRPNLTVKILNKKTEWCIDEDLIIRSSIYSGNPLTKVELYINGYVVQEKALTGRYEAVSFTLPANTYLVGTITAIVRAYDEKGTTYDSDVVNMIDCTDVLPEDRPYDKDTEKLSVVIDKKVNQLCVCDTLSFFGSVQGPNPIQTVLIRVNGTSINLNNLGTPPVIDPCVTGEAFDETIVDTQPVTEEAETFSIQSSVTDAELLEMEDFGAFLEAFEEREGCGCRNKKKTMGAFQMQSSPFTMMATVEETFQADIPYWKLRELGAIAEGDITIEVTAIDSTNEEATSSFDVHITNCEKPPVDENGNPRVTDCLTLESIEVSYYHVAEGVIKTETIPSNVLPYSAIDNGIGSKVTVGWRRDLAAPVLMVTEGFDETGYAFQVHAVAVNYLNEYAQPFKIWASEVKEKSTGVKNESKMLGDSTRNSDWTNDIANADYSTSPSLGTINDYVTFGFGEEWDTGSCPVELDYDPGANEVLEPPTDLTPLYECNTLTHVVMEHYDEISKTLKLLKVDISEKGKDLYTIQTANGDVVLAIGWSEYFQGPTVQIKSAAGDHNVFITAIGMVYTDIYGNSQTAWSTELRYQTNGVQLPEHAVGVRKDISALAWLEGDIIDYETATYIGKQNDMVSYRLEEEVTTTSCAPAKNLDNSIGVDAENPPDVPLLSFLNLIEEICVTDPITTIDLSIKDFAGLKVLDYGTRLNGYDYVGPFTDEVETLEEIISFDLDPSTMQAGDTIELYLTAMNVFGATSNISAEILVVNCLPSAKAEGDITLDAKMTFAIGEDINMGNFMSEWTQWNQNLADKGNWLTVQNAGRTELTNSVNQGGISGWFNQAHADKQDYYFEMTYQNRMQDDDMMGAFFRIQNEADKIKGFYAIEHDGGGIWAGGTGLRLNKYVVSDTGAVTATQIAASPTQVKWTEPNHRAFKVQVTLEGNKFTIDLYGDEVTVRPASTPAPDPITWVHLVTFTATDDSFATGAWGPITNSNPESYFWNLRMRSVGSIDYSTDSVLRKVVPVDQHVIYAIGDEGTVVSLDATTQPVKDLFQQAVDSIATKYQITADQIVQISYSISNSTLTDVLSNPIDISQVVFVPSNGLTPQETTDGTAIVRINTTVDYPA